MTTQDLNVEMQNETGPVERVMNEVEQVIHEAEESISHATPLGILFIISVFSVIVLIYRIAAG